MKIDLRKPGIKVLLRKNVGRTTVAGNAPLSHRYTGSGGVIDLTQYLGEHGSVRVTKSVRGGAGAFSIAFPDQIYAGIGDTLYALIEPMDSIEIYMAGNAFKYVGTGLPIMMRGFVSNVQRQRGMSADGKPTRMVLVSGQDYGKILQICQTFNLPFGPTVGVALSSFPFFARFGFSNTPMTVTDFLTTVLTKVVNPYLKAMRENPDGSINTQAPLTPLTLDCQNSGDKVSAFGVGGWNQGTMDALIHQFTDIGAWNECYIEDRTAGPYLVFRPNPYMDAATGAYIFNDVTAPTITQISDADVVTMSTERSDANVGNYYWVESPRFLYNYDSTARAVAYQSAQSAEAVAFDSAQSAEAGVIGGTVFVTTYGNCNPALYGLRKMEEQTQMAGGDELYNGMGLNGISLPKAKSAALDWVTARREALIFQNRDNVVFETGSIHLKGNENAKAGTYLQLTEGQGTPSQYYIDSVTHDYDPFGNYFTTAQFSRGTGFISRAQQSASQSSPYWAELVQEPGQ